MRDNSPIELSSHLTVLLLPWNLNPEDRQALGYEENIWFKKVWQNFPENLTRQVKSRSCGMVRQRRSETLINWIKICCRPFLYQNFFWSASQQNSRGEVQMLSLASQIFCSWDFADISISTSPLQRTLVKISSAFTDRCSLIETKSEAIDASICLDWQNWKSALETLHRGRTDRALASGQITKRWNFVGKKN